MSVNTLLFIGIESYTWSDSDFAKAIDLCKQCQLDGLLVKVFDGMQGEWYNGRFPAIYASIKSAGLICVPYGFHYGNNKGSSLTGEAQLGLTYMQTYGIYCGNLESSWDGQGDWAGQLAGIWAHHPGELWISTWANVGDEPGGHRWLTNIGHLAPITTAFMPECYSDSLYAAAQNDWPKGVHIEPTFDLSTEFGVNNVQTTIQDFLTKNKTLNDGQVKNITLWEYQFAQQQPALVKAIVQMIKGGQSAVSTGVMRNTKGANADFAPVSQFEYMETEDACGFFTAAHCLYAGLPNQGPSGTAEQVDQWADAQYDAEYGSHGANQGGGVSIDDMHRLFKAAGNVHYWDIDAIMPSSPQASDIAHVRAALEAGYLVAITVDEASVRDLDVGDQCPYEWNPQPGQFNHVFLLTGPGEPGSYLLAEDHGNVVGPLQGNNSVRPGPRRYDEKTIDIRWASIVQLVGPDPNNPWMLPIPSGDPTTWPTNFNAQNFAGNVQPKSLPANSIQQEAQDCWNSFFNTIKQAPPPFTSGIATAWTQAWQAGKLYGPPLTTEYHSKNGQGQDIIVQEFAHARCEWLNGTPTFYSFAGKI